MSPLKQLCWSAVGQAPWVQVGFKPQSWEERIHRLPWAEAQEVQICVTCPALRGQLWILSSGLHRLWLAAWVLAQSLLCHVAVSKVQGQKRGPTEALFLRAE